ncbi:MAG TPA: DUF364 domain-containing protein [Chloroflexia bacterium]
MDISLNGFIEYAKLNRELLDNRKTAIEFVVSLTERALISGNHHVYADPYLIAQLISGAQGACFMHPGDFNESDLEGVVGNPVLDVVEKVPPHLSIALLDALYFHLNKIEGVVPSKVFRFRGLASQKSLHRANSIVKLAEITRTKRVALIGFISDIAKSVIELGAELQVADIALAGAEISSITIQKDALPLIEWADTVIMTGNALKTNTINDLLAASSKLSRHVLVYSMTGSNIAPRYLKYGASIVTSETFPYYWYANSVSTMCVYT